MNAIALLETALMVGEVALYVGCPTAGVTWFAASFLAKRIATIGIKTAIRKGMKTAVIAGTTATIAAAMSKGMGGLGAGQGTITVSPAELGQKTCHVTLEEKDGAIGLLLGEQPVTLQELYTRVLIRSVHGDLETVYVDDQLPKDNHGEWRLGINELRDISKVSVEWKDENE